MKGFAVDIIKLIALVCVVVDFLSVTGCVSIHSVNPAAPMKEDAEVVHTSALQAVSSQTETLAQQGSKVQMVVVDQSLAPDSALGQVDILKDAKKPCSSVADDAGKFKK